MSPVLFLSLNSWDVKNKLLVFDGHGEQLSLRTMVTGTVPTAAGLALGRDAGSALNTRGSGWGLLGSRVGSLRGNLRGEGLLVKPT